MSIERDKEEGRGHTCCELPRITQGTTVGNGMLEEKDPPWSGPAELFLKTAILHIIFLLLKMKGTVLPLLNVYKGEEASRMLMCAR